MKETLILGALRSGDEVWRRVHASYRRAARCILVIFLLVGSQLGRTDAIWAQGTGEAGEPVEIALELLLGRPLVRGTINGEGPVPLLIDPQIETTRISPAFADRLELQTKNDKQPVVELAFDHRTVELVPVDIGDTSHFMPEFGPDAQPDAVLSLSVWRDQLVTLDYKRWEVRIEPGALPQPNGRDVFAMLSESHELPVQLRLNDYVIACEIDPWFSGGLLLPSSYLWKLSLRDDPLQEAPVATRRGVVAVREARVVESIMIAGEKHLSPRVLFGDIGDRGILGSGWLVGLSLTYDAAHGRARLSPVELALVPTGGDGSEVLSP